MSHLVVYNSAVKSVKIPTNPTTYLTEVRDEACQKLGVKKDQFTLKFNNKPISLSQQVRLANLPQGARLELVQASRSPTVISVALQLPATEKNIRLTRKFASNTSLWEILRQFESGQGANYNFTQRGVPEMNVSNGTTGAGRLNYEMPIITVMPGHKEQSDFVALQQTLTQLGFDNGSALLKLSFKNSGSPLEEAMAQISQYFKSPEPAGSGAQIASSAQVTTSPVLDQAPPKPAEDVVNGDVGTEIPEPEPIRKDDTQPTDSMEGVVIETVKTENAASMPAPSQSIESTPQQTVRIFAAPTSTTPQATRHTFNEADYVPTVEHAKSHQASLISRTRNQRLLSDKELAALEEEKQAKRNEMAQKGCSLRIRMPDQVQVQFSVDKEYKAETLYGYVQQFLLHKNEPFHLKYVGPNGRQVLIPRDKKRLIPDLGFSAAMLITFLWDDKASNEARSSRRTLTQDWERQAQTLKVQEPVVAEENSTPAAGPSKAEGKKPMSQGDKENKLKNLLNKGLFKKR